MFTAQLFDLGFEVNDYRNSLDLQAIIKELDEQLSLVLIREYLDESLVLLQRLLCWDLSDMVYMKRLAQYQDRKTINGMATSEIAKVCKMILFIIYILGTKHKISE